MKVVIVGGGAIGRLFAAPLAKGLNDVTIVDTNPIVVKDLQENGIGVIKSGTDSPRDIERVHVTALTDARSIDHCDLIILLVKSFATRIAVESVAHLVTPKSPIIFMQTGLGNQAVLREMFPVESIMAGITFMSGTAMGNSSVRQGREGLTFIGELGEVGDLTGEITPRLKKICKNFCECGIETRWSHRIISRLWAKVITYATINTLTTILKVPNGQLLKHEISVCLVKRLLAEGEAVARARGVEGLGDLYELFEEVIQKSSDNLSPMLQDNLNGRPTEIDAQSGAIAAYAENFGVEVPCHRMLASIIKLLEAWSTER